MSNVIGFKAYKNTLKRDSGYAPVSGENGYSVIRCVFPVGGDWDNISAVSAGFFVHPKNIVGVTADILPDGEERAALFTIPGALLKQGERLHFGLFATVGGVTIATNTVALDVERGIVSDDIDYDPEEAAGMFEQFSNALNTALLGKADKLVNGDVAFTDRILIASNNGGIKNSGYTINNARLSGDVNLTVPSSNVVAIALEGKADKAADGTDGELAALDGNGALKRSGVSVAESVGEGSTDKVPTTAAVKTALDGKADKAAAGTNGELAAFDLNGALIRSGINVAPSIGAGSNTKVPTTAAVKLALDGKADKAPTGAVGELAAVDGNGALIRSGVSVTQSVGAGGNSKVPTTEAVKTALNGKADKLSSGGGGELVSATGNGEIQRSGLFVAQSIGSGAANMLPTTNAVRQHVLSMLDEALNGSDDGAPSLFVRQNTQTGKYQLVYMDSNDVLHVLFDFGLLPAATGEKGDYDNLDNKPQINGVTLSGNKTAADLGVAGWEIAAIDNCIEDGVLYSTSINNQAAYVLARKITTNITQYAFCRDGRLMWRTRQAETPWQPAGEWSEWEEIGGGSQIVSGVVNQNGTITFTDSDGNTFTTTGANVVTSGTQQISMGYDNGGFYFLFDDGQEAS